MAKTYDYYTKTISLPNGKRKYIRGKTREELERKYAEAKRDLSNGIDIGDTTTVAQLAQTWVDVYRKPHLCERSLANVLHRLNGHVMPYIGQMKVRDVLPAHIYDIVNNHGYASKSTNSMLLADLRNIFRFAIDNQLISRSPVPELFKAGGARRKEEVPISKQQASLLLARSKDSKHHQDWLFAFIALETGMRRSEILGLTWDNVDFRASQIRVEQQLLWDDKGYRVTNELKTPTSHRILPMTPELKAVLGREKLARRSDFAVCTSKGMPLTKGQVNSMIKRWNAMCPDFGMHIHPHLFRHTYTTWLIAAGLDPKQVQYLMGHRDLQMTLGCYAHYQQEQRREETHGQVCEALGRLSVI